MQWNLLIRMGFGIRWVILDQSQSTELLKVKSDLSNKVIQWLRSQGHYKLLSETQEAKPLMVPSNETLLNTCYKKKKAMKII